VYLRFNGTKFVGMETKTKAQLDASSYRDLQTEAKTRGVNAKGWVILCF
jgi:hypothetical protein